MPHSFVTAEYKPVDEEKNFTLSRFAGLIGGTEPPVLLIGAALLFSLVNTAAQLVVPLLTKGLVDGFSLASLDTSRIFLLAGAFLVQMVLSALTACLLNYAGQKIIARLRQLLWKKQISLPVSYFDSHSSGDMISRMINDTAVIRELITTNLTGFVTGIISIAGSVVLLIYLDWKMSLLMITAVPLALAVLIPLGWRMHRIARDMMDENARFTEVLSQMLGEIRLVKSSGAEEQEYERGKERIDNLYRFGLKEGRVQAFISPLMSFVLMALLVIVIGYGGYRVSTGVLTSGDLVAFILYLVQILMPMTQVTMFFTQLSKTRGATESILSILGTEEERTTGEVIDSTSYRLSFNGVDFSYSSDAPFIRDMDFSLEPGEVTAIVGPSGGGKTTIFSLLERFYTPDRGKILLGCRNIKDISLESWRRKIGYVSQDAAMIDGTVRENIIYGLPGPVDREAVRQAARMAFAHDFICAFPEGYETRVGERGVKLSGGQRQRIAIARAFLREPEILMLDEATASLDSDSEIWVQEALKNLMKGRTVLIIAHRLSTVVDADHILFIEKGRISGSGNHQELMDYHRTYRRYAEHQLRSALPVM